MLKKKLLMMIILQESIWVVDKFCFIFRYTCSCGCNSVRDPSPPMKKIQSGLTPVQVQAWG